MAGLKDWLIAALTRLFPEPMNRIKINIAVRSEKQRRPHPFSLWTGPAMGEPPARTPDEAPSPAFKPSTYVSWPGLADRSFTGRHLPPSDTPLDQLPDAQEVFDELFLRQGEMIPCKKTSALFCFFAQWFTDSFLRTHPDDRRRHTGNNEIDYCQIYGLHEDVTKVLRSMSGGLMRMREEGGRSLLPFLNKRDGSGEYDPHFAQLPFIDSKYRRKIADSLAPPSMPSGGTICTPPGSTAGTTRSSIRPSAPCAYANTTGSRASCRSSARDGTTIGSLKRHA